MAKLTFDLSGIEGLVERHQGDLNDTTSKPHLRYLGSAGQFAEGIYNPIKRYGYMSPANNSSENISQAIFSDIVSMQYEANADTVYLCSSDENIYTLDGLNDTTLATYLSLTDGYDLEDMVIYEANGQTSLVYIVDTNTELIEKYQNSSQNTGGMYVGFKTIDPKEGITVLEKSIFANASTVGEYEVEIGDVSSYSRTNVYRKLAQEFLGGDVIGRKIDAVSIGMRRSGGLGIGITMKVSIQASAVKSTGIYTNRGTWGAGVSYALNDTVTGSDGNTFQCYLAHTSAAGNAPITGGAYEDYWNYFGSPDGVELASGTFSLSDVPVMAADSHKRFNVALSSPALITDSTAKYWIVIEEVGSNMTATDRLAVLTSVNDTGIYDGYKFKGLVDTTVDYWLDGTTFNGVNGLDTMDFRLISNRNDEWTTNQGVGTLSVILNNFGVETGQSSFLYVADNGLLYWVVGNKFHAIDGSVLGGPVGTAYEEVLTFPDYIDVADIAETRTRMYIGIHSTTKNPATDTRTFLSNNSGILIWDRKSQVANGADFYPTPGAKEIKSLFKSSDGTIKAITISNSGFSEIRAASGSQFAVVHTFERNGYPPSRRSVSQIGDMTIWLGMNGIFYGYGSIAPGEKEGLYKLGDITGSNTDILNPGAILVGNENTTNRMAVLYGLSFTS